MFCVYYRLRLNNCATRVAQDDDFMVKPQNKSNNIYSVPCGKTFIFSV